MTLESGDKIFFNVTSSGILMLQVFSYNKPEEYVEALEMKGGLKIGCDTVQLDGRDVALLLYRLKTANADGSVTDGAPGSKLIVDTLRDELGKVTVVLETDNNVIHMNAYERDMLVSAIESQAWRLFQ